MISFSSWKHRSLKFFCRPVEAMWKTLADFENKYQRRTYPVLVRTSAILQTSPEVLSKKVADMQLLPLKLEFCTLSAALRKVRIGIFWRCPLLTSGIGHIWHVESLGSIPEWRILPLEEFYFWKHKFRNFFSPQFYNRLWELGYAVVKLYLFKKWQTADKSVNAMQNCFNKLQTWSCWPLKKLQLWICG
jgi:hypothetical protein